MAWLKSPNIKDAAVSVNAKQFEFKNGLVQVENPEDIRIFCEYLHCEVVPDEIAKNMIAEAEGAAKTSRKAKGADAKTDEAKG